ncbi:MAG: hypothetical protein FJX56_03585 [Alphaproteobacteria bacterium]|nr:hypothetical protein [Alphaproteobacteria bacterium]
MTSTAAMKAAGAAIELGSSASDAPPHGVAHFRFFDNREKYLLFVTTCSEKWVIAEQVSKELRQIRPTPPALRVFDAGMGDATVLTRVMRAAHHRFPTVPMFVVGKEVSLEDVRLSLEKMADRFFEHPNTVLVLTNLYYAEAPRLWPTSSAAAAQLNWYEVALNGTTAHEFDGQIRGLQAMIAEGWQVRASERTGNPLYVRPSVLVLYREDHRFQLDPIVPRPEQGAREYDLILASQPFRARLDAARKVRTVLAPLVRAIAPGGRMLAIQSYGNDPGMEVINAIWPEEHPFKTGRQELVERLREMLVQECPDLRYHSYPDNRALFRYNLHVMPSELSSIGTSTLMAAWNAAVYVAQIDDHRLHEVLTSGAYLDATRRVLEKYHGLWFNDESFAVSRRPA